MLKVDFDLHSLLGDILSKDGLYVELLSCNEYTIWYLIRQAGYRGYVPVLYTKTFLNVESMENLRTFALYQDENLKIIMKNLIKFFGVGIVQYDETKTTIEDFIRKGIGESRFIHTQYDYYFDTLVNDKRFHDYHGHPITGCDDDRQIYLSIFPGKYEVRYTDMRKMSESCYKKYGTYMDKFFYLEGSMPKKCQLHFTESLKDEISRDCECMVNDWQSELEVFQKYVYELPQILKYNREKQIEFALQQRLLFQSIVEGMHGNFIFKLRLINETFGLDTIELEERFLLNRKKSVMIANMYRKASVILEDNHAYFIQTLNHIAERVYEIFIQESKDLYITFNNLIREAGLIKNAYSP